MDLKNCLERALKCILLTEKEMRTLCNIVKSIMVEENNLQPVYSPVVVCGDTHGQFYDVLELFKTGGDLPHTKYIFLGDYVDRGNHSVESWTLLMIYKALYPDCITLLRGNHETRQVTQTYGFYEECQKKFGTSSVWKYCCEVFDCLNLAALIDGKILCVHGGLSPDLRTLDQYRLINRRVEPPQEGSFCDIMWSDPEEIDGWAISTRGAGYLFGPGVTKEFNHINGLDMICRSHQLVQDGYQYHFDKALVNVWSAPNYCYRCGNLGAVLALDEFLNRDFKIFTESNVDVSIVNPGPKSTYFL
jgi:serine/threonine-protein phosphatase 6 catalytic subunit